MSVLILNPGFDAANVLAHTRNQLNSFRDLSVSLSLLTLNAGASVIWAFHRPAHTQGQMLP